MRGFKSILSTACLLWLFLPAYAQSLQLSLTDTISYTGDTVAIQLRAQQFDEIVSVQFSIQWDTEVIEYLSHAPADLDNVAIGDFQAESGELRFSWFDVEGTGSSLPDGSILTILYFKVVGEPGDQTPITITDTPLAIQIFRATATPGIYEPVLLEQQAGSVLVGTPGAIAFGVQQVRCNGAGDGSINLVLQGQPSDYTFSWTGPEDFTSDEANISGLIPGSYDLEVFDLSGALFLDTTVVITEPQVLALSVSATTESECDDPTGSVTLAANGGTSPYTFQITGGGQNQNGTFESLEAGAYVAIVTDVNACRDTVDFEIISPEAPQLELPDTLSLCGTDSVTIGAGVHEEYVWSTGATSDSITVTQTGTYSVTVTDDIGCTASDTVQVTVGQLPQAGIPLDYFQACPGDSVQLMVSGGEIYEWIDTSGTLSALDIPNPVAAPQYSGRYTVIVSNACGSDTASIRALLYEVTATAGPDTCFAYKTEGRLAASGGVIYQWQEAPYPVSNPTIPDPLVAPEENTIYVVEIMDQYGCFTVDSVSVMIATDPASTIVAVNMITPNGDGKNDILEFHGAGKFGQNTLKVYNRWGDLVYQKLNYQLDDERFDGTRNGSPLPAANYYYVLSFRSGEIKQTLTIVRD